MFRDRIFKIINVRSTKVYKILKYKFKLSTLYCKPKYQPVCTQFMISDEVGTNFLQF